ncbi:MAG: hypothetical protein Q4B52_03345 [Tissierellia bacterium]|nr:hypothetical protein [Tissierellia bacterium]
MKSTSKKIIIILIFSFIFNSGFPILASAKSLIYAENKGNNRKTIMNILDDGKLIPIEIEESLEIFQIMVYLLIL